MVRSLRYWPWNYYSKLYSEQKPKRGWCMYVHSIDLAFNQRNDISDDQLEMFLPHTRPIMISTCYRPQISKKIFNILENLCTQKRSCFRVEIVFTRGFKFWCFKNTGTLISGFKTFSISLILVIKEPTRITPTCSSILDVIIVPDEEKISQSGKIPIDISDHFLTYCTRHSLNTKFNKQHHTFQVDEELLGRKF